MLIFFRQQRWFLLASRDCFDFVSINVLFTFRTVTCRSCERESYQQKDQGCGKKTRQKESGNEHFHWTLHKHYVDLTMKSKRPFRAKAKISKNRITSKKLLVRMVGMGLKRTSVCKNFSWESLWITILTIFCSGKHYQEEQERWSFGEEEKSRGTRNPTFSGGKLLVLNQIKSPRTDAVTTAHY